jgi:hypothetical protein
MTATKIASAVNHQRQGWLAELFPFNGMQRNAQTSMYHPRAAGMHANERIGTCLFRCTAVAECSKMSKESHGDSALFRIASKRIASKI